MESNLSIEVNNYSSVKIGKSTLPEIIVSIQSSLDLEHTRIVTDPYGTTRIRFGYPEMFTYQLDLIEKGKYTLTITRSIKIVSPQTAKFFYGKGWNFDLVISFIPTSASTDIVDEKFGEKICSEILPKNYIRQPLLHYSGNCNERSRFDIGILVPIFSRNDYLEKFLLSLRSTQPEDLSRCVLLFMDESVSENSLNPTNSDRQKVNNTISSFINDNCLPCQAIVITKRQHGNMFDSILRGFDILCHYCDFLSTIDSDTIMKHNWISKLLETVKDIEHDQGEEKYILSGFNTLNAHRHLIEYDWKNYVEKKSVGGCHLMFRSKHYEELRCALNSYKWDTNLIGHAKRLGYGIYVTKPSVIEHIGYESSGHRQSSVNDAVDISCDFINKKIAIICGYNCLLTRMDNTTGKILRRIIQYSKYEIFMFDVDDATSEENFSKLVTSQNGSKVNVIFLYSIPQWKIINTMPNKRIYFIENVGCRCGYRCNQKKNCDFKNILQRIKSNRIDNVISRYRTYLINKIPKESNVDVSYFRYYYDLYHSAQKIMKEGKKTIDLLIFGNVDTKIYPLRRKVYDLFKKGNDLGINVKILPYSTKHHKRVMTTGKDLAEMISKSWLTLTTKSINNLMSGKYYEASIYGSVPCGDFPDLEQENFSILQDEMIKLSINMDTDQIINTIINALADKQNLLSRSKKLHKYFVKNYSLVLASIDFDKIMNHIDEN